MSLVQTHWPTSRLTLTSDAVEKFDLEYKPIVTTIVFGAIETANESLLHRFAEGFAHHGLCTAIYQELP